MSQANVYLWRIDIWNETRKVAMSMTVPPSVKLTRHGVPCVGARSDPDNYPRVLDADCLDVAHDMVSRGMNPVVLNLSDDCAAGGVVDLGSGAQEESLWRRTALCATQTQEFYPLCQVEQSLIYSPRVAVLRDTESNTYAWLDKPWFTSFIACPALKYPRWVASEEEPDGDLSEMDKAELAARLRLILDVAIQKGHDAIVLGPMGCGAWKNPPRAVARVFQRVLAEYTGHFREIVVAALTTDKRGLTTNAAIFRYFVERHLAG